MGTLNAVLYNFVLFSMNKLLTYFFLTNLTLTYIKNVRDLFKFTFVCDNIDNNDFVIKFSFWGLIV